MSTDRRTRLWTLVVEQAHGGAATVDHVGAVSITASGADAAAITVALAASPRETLYASDRVAQDMEELTPPSARGPAWTP